MSHPQKREVFEATSPPIVDARHTTKSYIIAYELLKELRHRNPESLVEVVFKNNKGLLKDLVTWCEVTGNELLSSEPGDDGKDMRCLIQKSLALERRGSVVSGGSRSGGPSRPVKSMCVLLSTTDLESLILPLDKAIAGAVMGMNVHVCFEDSGVRLLKKGFRATVSGLLGRIFTGNTESTIRNDRGAPLPSAALEMLEELGAQFYVCGPSLKEHGVREEEIFVKNFTEASAMTFVDLMAQSDINVFSKAEFERR